MVTTRMVCFGTTTDNEPILIQQGDYNSRTILLALFDSPGTPADLTDAVFSVVYRKNGINSKPFEVQRTDEESNFVRFTFSGSVAAEPGNGVLQLRMYKEGGLAQSALIPFSVLFSLEDGENYTDPEPAFAALIAEAREAISDAEKLPYIGGSGNWVLWDSEKNEYMDSGVSAKGNAIRILGSLRDVSQLPADADQGDAYLVDGDLYIYTTVWEKANVEGIAGKDGKPGEDGADGISPTVSVVKSGGKVSLTIKDAEGETTTDIFSMLDLFPVGSWWISDDPTSPAQLMGGTWESMAGRVLLGAGDFSGSVTYAVGETGGANSKNITKANLPTDAVASVVNNTGSAIATVTSYSSTSSGGEWADGAYKTVTIRTAANNGVVTRETLDIRQPYYVTNMWKRIE